MSGLFLDFLHAIIEIADLYLEKLLHMIPEAIGQYMIGSRCDLPISDHSASYYQD